MSKSSNAAVRLRRGFETARLLIGDIGIRVLLLLGLVIHLATVWIAFNAHQGLRAWIVALLSATVPAVPEVYWAYDVAVRAGTLTHPYVLAIIGYPIACALFLLGGWIFFPDRAARGVNATETE
jgi:hypothetical protein